MATKDALFLFWASNYPTCYHSGFSHLALTQTMELYKYISLLSLSPSILFVSILCQSPFFLHANSCTESSGGQPS